MVEQLNKMPARISILGLLIAWEAHRNALLKILNEPHVASKISPINLVGQQKGSHFELEKILLAFSLLGGSVSLSLVGKYICRGIAVVPCPSSSLCKWVVLRGERKKVNKDRSQKQGIPGARTRAEAASILIKERRTGREVRTSQTRL